jgi:hypothetical protein
LHMLSRHRILERGMTFLRIVIPLQLIVGA